MAGLVACGDDEPVLPDVPPVDEPEPEPVPEPTAGYLRIAADWSEALAETTIPTLYNIGIGGKTFEVSASAPYVYPDSLSTDDYPLFAYNQPQGITLSDGLASVDTTAGGLLVSPDYLFAADTTVRVAAGDTVDFALRMHRLVVPLVFTLNFSEKAEVEGATATLSGVLPSVQLSGDSSVLREAEGVATVALYSFEALPGDKGIRLLFRVLGFDADKQQHLSVRIALADGRKLTYTSDLTDFLADFAHLEPVSLQAEIDTKKPKPDPEPEPEPDPDPWFPEDDPDVAVEPGGTIEDWTEVDGGDVSVIM